MLQKIRIQLQILMLAVQQELVLEVKLVGRHMMAKICVYSFNNLNFLETLIPKVQLIK
jgi:hypothetical protein